MGQAGAEAVRRGSRAVRQSGAVTARDGFTPPATAAIGASSATTTVAPATIRRYPIRTLMRGILTPPPAGGAFA